MKLVLVSVGAALIVWMMLLAFPNFNPPPEVDKVNVILPVPKAVIETADYIQIRFARDEGGIGVVQTYYFDDVEGQYIAAPGDTLLVNCGDKKHCYVLTRSPGIQKIPAAFQGGTEQ
jgi:hypothetical protein